MNLFFIIEYQIILDVKMEGKSVTSLRGPFTLLKDVLEFFGSLTIMRTLKFIE